MGQVFDSHSPPTASQHPSPTAPPFSLRLACDSHFQYRVAFGFGDGEYGGARQMPLLFVPEITSNLSNGRSGRGGVRPPGASKVCEEVPAPHRGDSRTGTTYTDQDPDAYLYSGKDPDTDTDLYALTYT